MRPCPTGGDCLGLNPCCVSSWGDPSHSLTRQFHTSRRAHACTHVQTGTRGVFAPQTRHARFVCLRRKPDLHGLVVCAASQTCVGWLFEKEWWVGGWATGRVSMRICVYVSVTAREWHSIIDGYCTAVWVVSRRCMYATDMNASDEFDDITQPNHTISFILQW